MTNHVTDVSQSRSETCGIRKFHHTIIMPHIRHNRHNRHNNAKPPTTQQTQPPHMPPAPKCLCLPALPQPRSLRVGCIAPPGFCTSFCGPTTFQLLPSLENYDLRTPPRASRLPAAGATAANHCLRNLISSPARRLPPDASARFVGSEQIPTRDCFRRGYCTVDKATQAHDPASASTAETRET